jgi:hypothetical protein
MDIFKEGRGFGLTDTRDVVIFAVVKKGPGVRPD